MRMFEVIRRRARRYFRKKASGFERIEARHPGKRVIAAVCSRSHCPEDVELFFDVGGSFFEARSPRDQNVFCRTPEKRRARGSGPEKIGINSSHRYADSQVLSPRSRFVQEATGAIGERVGELRKGEKIEGQGAVSISYGS
jgi:hypothetical protein